VARGCGSAPALLRKVGEGDGTMELVVENIVGTGHTAGC